MRTRPRANEGSTLVLLHPGEVSIAELAGHLVAVLFAAAGPLAFDDVARILDVSLERLGEVCELLFREPPTGLAMQRHGDQLQLITAPGSAAVVERYLGAPPAVRLSRAALEALAVIAYRQPVTRGEIDAVRGVNSDSAVSTLLTRSLVAEVGRRETVGRPALLALTTECLQYLGIRSLDELPDLPPRGDAPGPDAVVADEHANDALAAQHDASLFADADPGDAAAGAEPLAPAEDGGLAAKEDSPPIRDADTEDPGAEDAASVELADEEEDKLPVDTPPVMETGPAHADEGS